MNDQWVDIDRDLLTQRAKQLAQQRESTKDQDEYLTLLHFTIMSSPFAIELSRVEGVTRINDIFSIPLTPPHIPGVVRRQGQTIALVSLRHFFHPETEALIDADFAVVVTARGKKFAIQAEEIEGVDNMPTSELLRLPDNYDSAQAPYLRNVTRSGVAVLDPEALVLSDRFGTQQISG